MIYSHKEIIPSKPNLFKNFYFKRTIRQYIYLFKFLVIRFYRFFIKFIKIIKWK